MEDWNNELIDVKIKLANAPLDKHWLLNEAFILWFTLIEGIDCENFPEDDRLMMLRDNFAIY